MRRESPGLICILILALGLAASGCELQDSLNATLKTAAGNLSRPSPSPTSSPSPWPSSTGAPVLPPSPTPSPAHPTPGALQVCTGGCPYSLLSQAVDAASPGALIEVHSGTYNDCKVISKDGLTIRGIGPTRPIFTGKICAQKGVLVTAAQDLTIENLEISGASNSDGNGAGIRHDALGFNLTLRNMYFHDNQDGVLTSSTGDQILIEGSRFERNGYNDVQNGYAHDIYIGHSAQVTIRKSQFLRARMGGHEVKSRADHLLIECSTLAGLDGVDSYSLELPEGNVAVIQNSVIEQGPQSENSGIVSFAAEKMDPAVNHSLTLLNNYLINDRTSGSFIFYARSVPQTLISGNTFLGPGSISNAGTPGGNMIYSDRVQAGFPAFPALPIPPCE